MMMSCPHCGCADMVVEIDANTVVWRHCQNPACGRHFGDAMDAYTDLSDD